MTKAAGQYGRALYALARDEGICDLVLEQMQVLAEAFQEEPDFLRLLASPNLSKQARLDILDASFREKLHPYLLNFLKILTVQRLIQTFPDCCRYVESCYYADNGIVPVRVYTAQPLNPEQTRLIKGKMENITGKTVILKTRIDPACLGGVRLCYDGKQVDGTVKSRLDAIGKLLKNTVI